MKTKYFNILVALLVLFSGNVLGQEINSAGTTIDTEKTETNSEIKSDSGDDGCALSKLIEKAKSKCQEKEEDQSPDFRSKSESRPLQVQMIFAGGPTSPTNSHGPGGGLHVGYFISKNLYIGMTSVAFADPESTKDSDNEDKFYDDEKIYGQDGADIDQSVIDPKHILEVRLIPWNFGLYFSGGLIYNGEESYDVSFNKRDRTINGNSYRTGLEAKVKYKATILPTLGIGYNHLFNNAINVGVGLNVAMVYPQTPEVDVKAVNSDSTVAQADLNYWKGRIEKNEKRSTALFTVGIGYSF